MPEEYVPRGEYEERIGRIDDENIRQNRRLENLEKVVDKITDLTSSIREMAISLGSMQKELEKQGQRLESLEDEPAEKWRTLTKTVLTVIASAVIGYLLARGGLA